mmetsp:Transcript_158305/g.280665  ORF Transcript_158305/g.280665 Transcript_158305/m.280665 type:complete len:675 (+) Transcript_158305:73-2097(+)
MDVLLEVSSESDADEPRAIMSSAPWSCQTCTLINPAGSRHCDACGMACPMPAAVRGVCRVCPAGGEAAQAEQKHAAACREPAKSENPGTLGNEGVAPQSTGAVTDVALQGLQRFFGFQAFRPGQRRVVETLLAGRDALFVFPTGAGKSLCYQLPALLAPAGKFGVIISPLIALMRDQVRHLQEFGVPAAALHSELAGAERDAILRALCPGGSSRAPVPVEQRPRLVYLSPELAVSPAFACTLRSWAPALALIAVDEAHCVSKWGHDFRPCYRRLNQIRLLVPKEVPWCACTATATAAVRSDVANSLQLQSHVEVTLSFDRPNLDYHVVHKQALGVAGDEPEQHLLRFISSQPANSAGIVYCRRKQDCESVAQALRSRGIHAFPYHAGLSKARKQKALEAFLGKSASNTGQQSSSRSAQVLVATIAFGMGVDKPDVRYVLHLGPPKSLSAYYQESGRAGRDGQPARCVLYYDPSDLETIAHLQSIAWQSSQTSDEAERASFMQDLQAVRDYCEAAQGRCRRRMLLEHFGEQAVRREREHCCDLCMSSLRRESSLVSSRAQCSAALSEELLLTSSAGSVHRYGAAQRRQEDPSSSRTVSKSSGFVTAFQLRESGEQRKAPKHSGFITASEMWKSGEQMQHSIASKVASRATDTSGTTLCTGLGIKRRRMLHSQAAN